MLGRGPRFNMNFGFFVYFFEVHQAGLQTKPPFIIILISVLQIKSNDGGISR